jgi:hypothetical protein
VLGVGGVHAGGAHVDGDAAAPGVGHVDLDVAEDLGTAEVDRYPFPCYDHRFLLAIRRRWLGVALGLGHVRLQVGEVLADDERGLAGV